METLSELLRRIDGARDRLRGYDMVNHYAYLRWPEAERIKHDVEREKAQLELEAAERAYRDAIRMVAKFDPE